MFFSECSLQNSSSHEKYFGWSNPADDSLRTQDARELRDVVRVRERF
jgi:hypothetical protein